MPIYDYRCDECGHRFSAVQSFNDAPIATCPNCGKAPRRLITAPAIVFKGSGWYKTDSRTAPKDSDGSAPADKADKADKSDKSEKDKSAAKEAKSETQAAKTESTSEKSETKSAKTETKSDSKPAAGGSGKSEAKP